MGSLAATCPVAAPAGHDFESLQQQLESMTIHGPQAHLYHTQPSPQDSSLQTSTSTSSVTEDQFRITLYLSLIPRALVPKHLFTIHASTNSVTLRKATDRTLQFLNQLEELWLAADFTEELVLECLVRAVSARQQRWGGNFELTTMDLELAKGMVESSAGGMSPASETGSESSDNNQL